MSLKRGILIVLMSVWTVCEAQVNLSNGLVAHWTFDGNLQDSAGGPTAPMPSMVKASISA